MNILQRKVALMISPLSLLEIIVALDLYFAICKTVAFSPLRNSSFDILIWSNLHVLGSISVNVRVLTPYQSSQ